MRPSTRSLVLVVLLMVVFAACVLICLRRAKRTSMSEKKNAETLSPPQLLNMDGLSRTIWNKLDKLRSSPALSERFPRFMDRFDSLHSAIKQTFDCGIDMGVASKADIAIYGLGRLCLEDFIEIVFLVEHDYGYAALKLLRGLYERAVTNEAIVENPAVEAPRFVNYFAISERKFTRPAMNVYKNWGEDPVVVQTQANMGDSFERLKGDYKYEPCTECGRAPQMAWTHLDLASLAESLGKATDDPELKHLGQQLRDTYLLCAMVPNDYIHASIVPIFRRLSEVPEHLFDAGAYALSNAHVLILLALDTQNRYFKLNLESTLERLHRDRDIAWPKPVSGPAEGGD